MRSSPFVLPLFVGMLLVGPALAAPPVSQPSSPSASSASHLPPRTAQNKPPAKPAAKNATTGSNKTTRTTENAVRRQISGGPTYDDAAAGADTPELRALAAAERELFPPASPSVGTPWPQDLPLPVAADADRPRV